MAAPATCRHGGKAVVVLPTGRYCHWCWRNDPVLHRACTRCGRVDRLNQDLICTRCYATVLIEAAVNSETLRAQPLLVALRDHLRAADPEYILRIKKQSHVWQLIVKIAALPHRVSHEALDAMGSPRSVSQVRSLLVALEIMPARDEYAVAVERLVTAAGSALPPPDDQVKLPQFIRWRQQRRRRPDPLTMSQASNDRTELRVIVDLIGAFNAAGQTVATGQQAALDEWATRNRIAFRARRFLAWCASSGINRSLIPPAPRGSGFRLGGDLGRDNEAALRRALDPHDVLSPRMRLAVLPTTVYAVRVHRIAALRRDAVHLQDGMPRIRLGELDTDLPDAAAPWIAAIRKTDLGKRRAGGGDRDDTWVFPGSRHDGHILPSSLAAKLRKLGVSPVTAHQASAASLIAQLPPAVVARVIGVKITTAAGWLQLAGTDLAHR